MPGITHWKHQHFYAYFPGVASLVNVYADMLSIACGGVGFTWVIFEMFLKIYFNSFFFCFSPIKDFSTFIN